MATSLIGVSDRELVDGLTRLVSKEQKYLHQIILHFAEFDRRRLYAELGYTSLFDYATRGLGYSNSSAQRRVKAARAVNAVPEVYDCIESGMLSLKVLEVVAEAISGGNGKELLMEVCGKTRDEALRVVSRFHPIQSWRLTDSIVPITVTRAPVTEAAGRTKPEENNNYFRAEVITDLVRDSGKLEVDEKYRIAFTAGAEFKQKLERVRELVSGADCSSDTEAVLERALDEYIKRHAPEERIRRRQEKAQRKAKAVGKRVFKSLEQLRKVSGAVVASMPEAERDPINRRFIGAAQRDEILQRDGHCCSYVSPDGTQCGSRLGLEIDHIIPWACGGRSDPGNLRTVCKTHNLMFARKIFGDQHVEMVIQERKRNSGEMAAVFADRLPVLDPAERMLFG